MVGDDIYEDIRVDEPFNVGSVQPLELKVRYRLFAGVARPFQQSIYLSNSRESRVRTKLLPWEMTLKRAIAYR